MKALTLKVEAHLGVSDKRICADMLALANQLDCRIESRACGDKLIVEPGDTMEQIEARRERLRKVNAPPA